MRYLYLIILLFGIIQISCSDLYKGTEEPLDYVYVTRVIDGDTFWAEKDKNVKVKIRLIGIDAPETRKSAKKDIGYYGEEAKDHLKSLLEGQTVQLSFDVDSLDRYGRTLAYVYLPDGTFVNADLIKNGYARTLTIPPNVKHADVLMKLQTEARENKRGMWQ
ncbi:nuclease [Pseudoxanthomonas sp. SGD-10]|nr:nuclease [Pseudoxanthomonas sp. SGD-10]